MLTDQVAAVIAYTEYCIMDDEMTLLLHHWLLS